jgi:hypothetical protein
MKKVKANRHPAVRAEKPVPCPVLPIAVRVGELWDAGTMAEERGGSTDAASDQIYRLRLAVEELASFERARSPAGALFQLSLVLDAAIFLFDTAMPDGDKSADPTWQKLLRLLDSVALVLRDACTAEEYHLVEDVVKMYMLIDGRDLDPPFKWREDIPELAKEYRSNRPAQPAEA